MENRAHAWAAGIFVVVVTVLLLLLAAWLTRDSGTTHTWEISTREAVTGLQAQAPVRYRGVDVGKVADIGFDPKTPGNVLVRMAIEPQAPITRATYATLSFQGVTGLAYIQLDDDGSVAQKLPPDDADPPRIPLRPGLFARLEQRGEKILDQVEQASGRLNALLDDPNRERIASALEGAAKATTAAGQAAASVSRLADRATVVLNAQFGPERVSIPQAVRSIDEAVTSLRQTSDAARVAVSELATTAQRINARGGPVDRLSEGAAAMSQAAENFNSGTLPRLNQVADETSRVARTLQRTVNNIGDNPQALIFGPGNARPGPGEPGFVAPAGGGQ